jgi:signal transduction histidine kinase/ActR/RegA family two-component response regulator
VKGALQQRIELEQIGMVYRYATNVFGGLVVLGLVLAYVITIDHSPIVAVIWFVALVSTALVRWLLQRRFLSRERTIDEVQRWRTIVVAGAAATGLMWSLPGSLLVPDQTEVQLFLCACMMGIIAAAVSALAPVRHAFTWFVAPFIGPVAFVQLLQGGNHLYFGVGLLLFMGAMLGVAHRFHSEIVKMLSLVFENEELTARLVAENRHRAQVNADLQEQVAERQRAEGLLQTAKMEAEQASRAKSQFLANMSHEVRTPLNAIMGMTDLLKRTTLDAKQAKFADAAYQGSVRLLGIIDDILDLSRVEAGRVRLQYSLFSPHAWVADTVGLLAPQAAEKKLRLVYDVDDAVPLRLRGDPERLQQILVNLITNAIKFTHAGSIQVVVKLNAGDTIGRAWLHCAVMDTGAGIAPEMHNRLFKPFSQLDESTTRRFGGTGLGLAICWQLVTAMGGRIGLNSVLGQGSTFWFEVPSQPVEPAMHERVVSAVGTGPLQGHVLVAEDNEINRELLIDMLHSMGCTCDIASTGVAVIEKVATKEFDAVIMDWHMPEMDGLQAARLIRSQGVCAKNQTPLPIIALTASVMAGDRQTCLDAGMNDYLGKPFSYDALADVLRRWLPAPELVR